MSTVAYKLILLSKGKHQYESQLGDPDFTKLIGHYSVYLKAGKYVTDQDEANSETNALEDGGINFEWAEKGIFQTSYPDKENTYLGEIERLHSVTTEASVIITERELESMEEGDVASDPFTDAEESDLSSNEDGHDTYSKSSIRDYRKEKNGLPDNFWKTTWNP